jgi:hypothetical protein
MALLKLQRLLRAFKRSTAGSVSVITAVALPALVGMAGLAVEYGGALATKAENQRVADLGAYAGAVAYNASGSTVIMRSVVSNVAALNGLAPGAIVADVVNSPTGDGAQAVRVSVTTTSAFALTRVLGGAATAQVAAASFAELKASAKGCIVALNPSGSGVTLSGGTTIQAPGCAVASNTSVSVPCGTKIVTTAVNYGTSAPSVGCGGITAPSGATTKIVKAVTADPLAGSAGVTTATARLSSVLALTSPGAPSSTGGSPLDFGFSKTVAATQAALSAQGCNGSFSSGVWTVTCAGTGPFKFGDLTVEGGVTLTFNESGSSTAVYDVNSITMTGSAASFGPGTYNIVKGINAATGTTTFGPGAYNVGAGSFTCNGTTGYSICDATMLTVQGPSTFVLQGGVYAKGGSTLNLGSGSSNSFNIGKASDGNSFAAGGGSNTVFGDATAGGSLFQMAGNLNVVSGGGSCLTVSAAAQHDINGNFVTAGGTILGAGVYTVSGYIGLGTNGGGDVTCNGATVGMQGSGVTFVVGAAQTIPSGTCAGLAFCVAAGYGHVTLTAPTSGSDADLLVIGPTGSSTAGAGFAQGSSNTNLSGTFYFPKGPITLSGAASVGGSGCLQLVGAQVTLAGGSALASPCASASMSTTSVVLVQ